MEIDELGRKTIRIVQEKQHALLFFMFINRNGEITKVLTGEKSLAEKKMEGAGDQC